MTKDTAKQAVILITRLDELETMRVQIHNEFGKCKACEPVAAIALRLHELAVRLTTRQLDEL